MSSRLVQWEQEFELSVGVDWGVRCFEKCASTMNIPEDLIPEITVDRPVAVISRIQTGGRGRHGRVWEQAEEALYTTFVFYSPEGLQVISGFSLAVGVVLAEVFTELGAEVALKWPNDVLTFDRRKLAGVLIELSNFGGKAFVQVGIGVNISGAPKGAVGLDELGVDGTPAVALASKIAPMLKECFDRFSKEGLKFFREDWLKRSIHSGQTLEVDTGGAIIEGKFFNIGDGGSLELEVDGEIVSLISGQILM